MENYLPLPDAARMIHIPEQVLKQLVQMGIIRATMLSTTGVVLVNERDVISKTPIKQRPEYAQFAHLAGQEISLSECKRRYGVSHATLSRWVKKGFIAKLGHDGRAVLVDEAEAATYALIYKNSGGGQGRWVFSGDGTTYSKKRQD